MKILHKIILVLASFVLILLSYLFLKEIGSYITVVILSFLIISKFRNKKDDRFIFILVGLLVIFIPISKYLVDLLSTKPMVIVLVDGITPHNFSFEPLPVSTNSNFRIITLYSPNCSYDLLTITETSKIPNSGSTPILLKPSLIGQKCIFEDGGSCYFYTISVINSGSVNVTNIDVHVSMNKSSRIEVADHGTSVKIVGVNGAFEPPNVHFIVQDLESLASQVVLIKSSDIGISDIKCNVNGESKYCDSIVEYNDIFKWPKDFKFYYGGYIEHPLVGNNSTYSRTFLFNNKARNWEEIDLPYQKVSC